MEAYLDNSATTPLCKEAIAAVNDALTVNWGNPSSLHIKGIEAERVVEEARSNVAQRLFVRPDEVYFTSGGTESNNIAVFGAVKAMHRRGNRIVTSVVEHPSVLECMKHLEYSGYDVVYLPVNSSGRVSENDISRAINSETILVSLMAVNNEVGTIQPVECIKQAVNSARAPALIHCDAVQAFGKMQFKPVTAGVDLLTVSAHKIHGPKGAGALYIRNGVNIISPVHGGSQEKKIRPGTEPVPAIAGFGAAAKILPNPTLNIREIEKLRNYFLGELSRINGIVVNSPRDALPYVVNISVLGQNSEPMLNHLSARGIFVSGGSACSKGKKSRILKVMGLNEERINGALRISFSRFTTMEQIDMLVAGLYDIKRTMKQNR